jgi:hypothetical protein
MKANNEAVHESDQLEQLQLALSFGGAIILAGIDSRKNSGQQRRS